MARKVQIVMGNTGYRHQLGRARRFLDRIVRASWVDWSEASDVDFQDMAWGFFQNCWHVKDWLEHDPNVPRSVKDAAIALAHQSADLKMCREMCNGTKHLRARAGATHGHIDMSIDPKSGAVDLECMIDDGKGQLISGKELGRRCIVEWERILKSQGLPTS